MNILILGASGMAGHTIALYMLQKGHRVTTFSRKPIAIGNHISGDVTNTELLEQIILNVRFDAVINCVGMLNESCNQALAKAIYVNSYLPHKLAELAQQSSTSFIHMSTDCVFSGQTAPYVESSIPDGPTYYDRTKALGEPQDQNSLTFRNSIIGPDMNADGIGLFNWFMRQDTDKELQGYTKAIWSGVTTLTLARAMELAIVQQLKGLYHLVYQESINKYELLQLFNKHFKNNRQRIIPTADVSVDKTLINTRKDFPFEVPDYEKMIVEMKDWIKLHPSLYPHYNLIN